MIAHRVVAAGLTLLGACATPDGGVARDSARETATHPDSVRGVMTDDWTPAPVGAATFVVNRATRGMAARVRWSFAPDSGAILVVEDPAGVENEAVPDGVLFATERTGRTWRMDSVWSVAPSPDWLHVAVGRAVVLGGGEQQVVAPSRWGAAARSLAAIAGSNPALDADSLRAHSYPVSGMAVAEGAAVTFVADVGADLQAVPVHFVSLDGWRVRWSADGRDLLIGVRPARVQDDAPATTTRRIAVAGQARTAAPAADSVDWVSGPTLDISEPVVRHDRTLHARGRMIESTGNRITVRDSSASGWSGWRVVGPGVPLAATRHGRFILAIAPRTDARPHESPDRAVVYRVP